MSENVQASQNRERTQSLFDILINNSKNETENSSYIQQQQQQVPVTQQPSDSSAITSSLIENLLTEYLISLPTSLEEFYKIMGEIYVSEILKQCPHISSPVELMKETLLGRFNNNSDGTPNRSFLNGMIRHILQSNLQTNANNPVESQVMRNMMYREPEQPQAAPLQRSESTPDYAMASNSVMSSLIQNSKPEDHPLKLNIPKAKPVIINSQSERKRDAKANKIKAEVVSESKPEFLQNRVNKPKINGRHSDSDSKIEKIADNESLIEKAKRLLNLRRSVIQKEFIKNHKRVKQSDNCEVRIASDNHENGTTDGSKLGYQRISSSATSDTIRDIFEEILESIIR